MGYYAGHADRPALPRRTVAEILEETRGWSLFGRPAPPPPPAPEPGTRPRMAVAALLVEVAYGDGALSAGERRYIEWVLCREFGLDRESAERLLRDADVGRESEPDVEALAGAVVAALSVRQRRIVAQRLEELAHVNRAPTRGQDYTVRRIANLLRVGDDRVRE